MVQDILADLSVVKDQVSLSGLNLDAEYGYNKSRYEKAEKILSGKSLGAPENMANFWVSYKMPVGKVKGLGLGFGGNYVGEVTIIIQSSFLRIPYLRWFYFMISRSSELVLNLII